MEQHEIAGHRVVRTIGTGGMGSVYLVQHPRLPRQEALKLVDAELSTDQLYRARFAREADVLAQLDHPNIVHLYDRGEVDGRLWLTMEYIDGPDTATMLDDYGRLPLPLVADIVSGVAAALDHAWTTARLAHRDVKPANILVRQHPGVPPTVKLADFGVATGPDRTRLTQTGLAVGTLPYLAPESLQGAPVDDKCDQYSLACTAFHLLTGRPPFSSGSPATMMHAHLSETPPPPSASVPGLPPHVDAAIARATAKDPRDRFPSSTAFANALRGPAQAAPAMPAAPVEPPRAKPATRALEQPLAPIGHPAAQASPNPSPPNPSSQNLPPGQSPPGQHPGGAAAYGGPQQPQAHPAAQYYGGPQAPPPAGPPPGGPPPYGRPLYSTPPPDDTSSGTGSGSGSGKKAALIAGAVLMVMVLLAVVGYVLLNSGDSGDSPQATSSTANTTEATTSTSETTTSESTAATADSGENAPLSVLDGEWTGTYTCNQGETALTLTFRQGGDRQTRATFAFGPTSGNPRVPRGSFEMIGVRITDDVVLTPFRWIDRPGDFEMVGLIIDGPVTDRTQSLSGTVSTEGCTRFAVSR
ncbi:serine/threonine protein kinase [Gordonia iterans]|uniref:non-specific serine/threonine protein kinase n=1 Tax=Gordonia iterans TaxID=1004901 RepID=A0A2S0KCA7_9ACTN|nr:serine/threonine-protein kinase [Gordonia iterans]AVL99295.1 serine/threonine protein kinase [Gordonia iterans]